MSDKRVRAALLDYLRSGRRLHVLRENQPLWTRHDGAGEPGAQLSSWSFVENLKRYAREAGIGEIHFGLRSRIGTPTKRSSEVTSFVSKSLAD